MHRPRPSSPAALAALGLAGALGAAPAAAQEATEPATTTTTTTAPPAPVAAAAPVEETTSATTTTAPVTPVPEPAPEPAPAPAAPAEPAPAPAPATADAAAGPDPDAPAKPTAPGTPTGDGAGEREQRPARDRPKRERPRSRDRDRDRDDVGPAVGRRPKREWTKPAPPAPSSLPTPASGPTAPGDDAFATAAAAPLRSEVLESFRIPPFLLPIYQAAGTQYGIRWEILAAINEIETDYGRNLNVSSAGAQGWMQFMPATWEAYGTDANRDGERDPYNPVDAIFAAARYLKAAGAAQDLRKAIWAYNHADWYVESVLQRARRIASLPTGLVDGLVGLTQGRFPVLGDARLDRALRPVRRGGRLEVTDAPVRRGGIVFTDERAPVIAVQDGKVVAIGRSARLGRYLILEDAFGNRYTYARLGDVARTFAVAKEGARPRRVREPAGAPRPKLERRLPAAEQPAGKERLFANPSRSAARAAGGGAQLAGHTTPLTDRPAGAGTGFSDTPVTRVDVSAYERKLLGGLRAKDIEHRPLEVGSEIVGGTVLGHAGRSPRTGRDLVRFEIRPGGKHGPRVDPVPFLDGLRLVQRSGMERRLARGGGRRSVGQVLLLGKQALIRRVLADERISFPSCGRRDVAGGVIDRRVLATLALLAESGLHPTVTSLRCDHGTYTASGNVSHHSTGTAVDIGSINGVRIQPSTQGPGSITDRTIRRILRLQGAMAPAQIISLMEYAGEPSTMAMSDHADHIHLGWRPGGSTAGGGDRGAASPLDARQWRRVVDRLSAIDNPELRR